MADNKRFASSPKLINTDIFQVSKTYIYKLKKTDSDMFLIFDTETTGLPADYKAPLTNFENWPRLVQLA